MKAKSVVLLMLICVVSMLFSEAVVSQSPLQVISQNSGQIRLRLQTPQLELKESGDFQSLSMTGALPTADDGMPALPMFSTYVAIPAHGDFNVRVQGGTYTTRSNIVPKPVFATEEMEAKGEYNVAAYKSSGLYPANTYGYSPAQIIRDFRVVQISLYPVQYDAANQEIRICNDMTVEINMNSAQGENELPAYTGYSPAFTHLYESMISNFDAYRDPMLAPANPRILIIYGNSTDATYLAKLNEFVAWKRQKGYEVNYTSTAQTGGTSNTAIKTYIQGQYDNPATRPDYIILLGDVTGNFAIPAFTETMSSYGGEGDYPYTHLAGNDLLGDVFIGRISAENVSQVDVLFSKIYAYEKTINTNPTAAAWLNRMLLIGDPSSSGVSTRYVNMFIKELAKYHNPDYSFVENYSGGFSTTINTGINQGVGFFNYRGYIGMSGWSPGTSLVNGTKLPHATIITCATGNYASTGTTESLMRLGTSASPAGSVTAIGMATSGTHTLFNNCLAAGIYDGIFTNGMRSMGEALLNGKLYLKQIYGATHDLQANYFSHWCNLMGDPTVEVWTGIPGTLTILAPAALPIGTNTVDLQVLDAIGNPAANITVTAYSNAQQAVVAKGFTDENGYVTLTLSSGMQNDILITASAHEMKPAQQSIAADGSGSLVFVGKQIIDYGTSGSSGNNDGYAEAGETIALGLQIKNSTASPVSGVMATISCDDPYVSVINSQSSFNTMAAGEVQTSQSFYTLSISPSLPADHDIRISVALVDAASNNYTIVFHVTSYNAKLLVQNHSVTGGGNNILDPAEEGFLQIGVKNNSVFGISDIYAELSSLNDLISVTDSVSFIGNIPPGAISTSIDGFELFARALLIPGMQMPLRVRFYNNSGFEQIADFNIPIGQVTVNTPLGPDAYGYFIYDMSDTDYTDCPTYEWIEINPAQGGLGTLVPGLNDAGTSNDEGDQSGSVVVQTVDLPFQFPFYGVSYSQLTVCVNGFIVMGVTGNGEFRNYRLPGGYGPSPMIAPFWDDLILISDAGIYTYYDAAEHRFIVQYHKMRNGYNRTSVETFEVIFYDPIYYPTSMGDGMIKIQYKDFNNVDVGGGGYTPLHGNYATIGIKDHTNTRGLEYSYNNQYAYAAQPLSSGKSLLITTAPVLHENAFLVVDNLIVTDANGNSIAEPGETIELGVKLINLGLNTAQNISLTATTTSDYASFGNASSQYADIAGDSYGVNLSPLLLQIDLDCPDGIVVPVNCTVTINGDSWQYPLSITVHKPVIEVSGMYMNDSLGNGNGLLEPGETIDLVVNYTNNSSLDAKNITSNIMCLSEYVSISVPSVLIPCVPSGATNQAVYRMTISPDVLVGNNLTFYLTYLGDLITPQNEQLVLSIGTTGMNENFETSDGNFVANPSSNGWEWGVSSVAGAHSGTKVWGTRLNSQYPANVTYTLTTPSVFVGSNFMLEFWHSFNTESGYDGGNVKVSNNNGSSWMLLIPEGGYTSNNLNILSGPGFDGNSGGWQFARFNLSSYANQNIQFRFTFASDGLYEGDGWFIDDVRTTGFVEFAGMVTGTVTSSNPEIDFDNVIVQNDLNWGTHPDSEGNYILYLPIGTHEVNAIAAGYHSDDPQSVSLSLASQSAEQDFYLGYLAPATGLGYGVTDGVITLHWNSPIEPEFPVTAYQIFRRMNAGAFEQVGYVTDTSYTETLAALGTNYFYRVVCTYAEGNSLPTEDLYYHYTTANGDIINPALVNKLMNNYPNPFNPETTFSFSLKEQSPAKLCVYNIKGQLVKTLVDDVMASGIHQVHWNGRDVNNRNVASGIYFYRLETKNYRETKRAILMK